MGTYFREEPKKERQEFRQISPHREHTQKKEHWESGQAILHREHTQKKRMQPEEGEKKNEPNRIKNSYGTLNYLKKDKKRRQEKEGFSLEAFEAPGTPLHTEKEKHLDPASMKNVIHGDKQMLFSSELPLRSQALFYDLAGSKKSEDFLECMKQLIRTRGHQTLSDVFGFLDQESEHAMLNYHKEEQKEQTSQREEKEILPEEFSQTNHRIDALNSRLLRKEAKERQLRQELQLMLDQRTKEENPKGLFKHLLENDKKQQKKNKKETDSPTLQRQLQSNSEMTETDTGNETEPSEEDAKNNAPGECKIKCVS